MKDSDPMYPAAYPYQDSGVLGVEALEELSPLKGLSTKVNLHYPQPTKLTDVLLSIAKWSHISFIMDPAHERPIQVFAPNSLRAVDGFKVFLASLDSVGLRAIFLTDQIVKIAPKIIHGADGVRESV